MRSYRRYFVIGMIIIFFSGAVFPSISGSTDKLVYTRYNESNPIILNTIIVPDDYSKIQDAIDNANDYDTIFVRNGIYFENLVVEKPISLIGENKDTTYINGNGLDKVIEIKYGADYTNMIGFTIEDGAEANIEIHSSFNTIQGNIITDNNKVGILILGSSDENIISENIITNNFIGIEILSSFDNNISRNYISKNGIGIEIDSCQNNTISGNTITENGDGILLYIFAHKNIIIGNTIAINNEHGILFWESSSGNTIIYNNIKDNNVFGIKFQKDCSYNILFCNNFLNNNKNVDFTDCYNKFSKNYWGKPGFFLKAILGKQGAFPWIQFDWFPAKGPYDI